MSKQRQPQQQQQQQKQQQQKQQQQKHKQSQKHAGGTAFEVPLDDGNITPRSRKPHHLDRRLEDARPTTPDVIARRQRDAEARRKKQEQEVVNRVGRHNDRVERVAKEAEQKKQDEKADDG